MFRHNLILADIEKIADFNKTQYQGLDDELANGAKIRIGGNGELCTFEVTRVFRQWIHPNQQLEIQKRLIEELLQRSQSLRAEPEIYVEFVSVFMVVKVSWGPIDAWLDLRCW